MTELSRPGGALPHVLVVDDQDAVRDALRLLLKHSGYRSSEAATPADALSMIQGDDLAAVLVDMNYGRDTTSGEEGLALIRELTARRPDLPVIAMTAWASIELAVEAMREGAVDFIEKPWQNARLLSVLESRIALKHRERDVRRLSDAQALLLDDGEIFVAESLAMRRLMDDVARIATSDAAVLLLGENGSGKSVLAKRIHRLSPRRARPFVKVDIGGLAPTLFEAELFGHVKGAYTDARQDRAGRFETADGGSLFLDEIGNLPLEQQPKLLRVLEGGEFERLGASRTQRVDVRVIAATNADLDTEVDAGRFREDLLYRLSVFPLRLPPLRERREDIVPLARHYLATASRRYRRDPPVLDTSVERALLEHTWAGNVRELAHAMERAALLGGDRVSTDDLRLRKPTKPRGMEDMTLDDAEAAMLRVAIERHDGNLLRAAEHLGITRQRLYRRMEKYGLQRDDAE
ncbi:sigma-54-dependent Fis family transcriptional regulator [Luteibacter rhizovicinus DSM 16549]|uniref:Sigma-54-dependent Fis family transcriptional regulator n=1 Tax=Luteibacter rhizovicinus DSM 16549 TaxID=1440763 RepID=A0A0G9HDA0_9GAMM|nr:sigma-54 dependent transcriptional regulator [Luteibacter rhizovicinus]APG05907.1 sigma-54-dependent Fis family transcriptional regulator [Luteibacter rhizovicinus DSM 16549]KLD67144.1 chemotaxis protein CheY [Luteibacter rhizovicinus DSM 16549]